MTNIQEHLWHLGIGRRLKGYKMTVLAVNLAIADEERLLCAQEFLYKPIAAKLGCDFHNVERNIRTVMEHAWHTDSGYLTQLAGYRLPCPPTVTQFLDIMVSFFLRERDNFTA